jgi:hypothetical protein
MCQRVNKTIKCRIKEKSLIARVAAAKLGSRQVAIVIGRTIHLHNTSAADFLANSRWVRHEAAHVRQFHQYGFIPFVIKYLVESMKKGYRNNRYEVEARAAEADLNITSGMLISAE